MFAKTADYYDAVYAWKDYAGEAAQIQRLIRTMHPQARTLLDVGCGTGEHARLLSAHYRVDGIDIEPAFVMQARHKVATSEFIAADMRKFDIGKRYDVVQCLFSAIGYVTEPADVVRTLRCFARHLNPGGIILVEPWFTPDDWDPRSMPNMTPAYDTKELKICRVSVSSTEGGVSSLHFHYLIAHEGEVNYLQETHRLALYSVDDMLSFFNAAGLTASHEPKAFNARGLYIARAAGSY